jgi:acyl dehydratase
MNKAKRLSWEEILVGNKYTFKVRLTEKMVNTFLELTGDYNPLHADPVYAARTKFKERVVPGMLLASLFSRLVGMQIPGEYSLYMSQKLSFKHPAFIGDEVLISGEVIRTSQHLKIITIKTQILNTTTNELLVDGEGQALYIK